MDTHEICNKLGVVDNHQRSVFKNFKMSSSFNELLNCPASVLVFDTQRVTSGQKLTKTMVIVFVQFGVVWFLVGSYEIFEATIDYLRLSICFLIPNMSLQAKNWSKPWFWLYFEFWFCFVGLLIGSNYQSVATIEFPSLST